MSHDGIPAPQEPNDLEKHLKEQARLAELEEYRKRAMEQWFEDGSCTGGNLNNK